MLERSRPQFHVAPEYQPVLGQLGLDAEAVLAHPDIKVWRTIPDRQNCTLDATLGDGRKIRFHIKRYRRAGGFSTPAAVEARGLMALIAHNIPTAPLVGWGSLADGRSFVILDDLAGYRAADKLVEEGFGFARLLEPTADLAARLHNAGLHHRDLYLCHFFAKAQGDGVDLRLIDAARVRPLPWFLMRGRWIVKDLSQFWYSTLKQPISDEQRTAWLNRYAQQRRIADVHSLRRRIERKIPWMARHDAILNRKQPHRNISIPRD